MKTKRNSVWFWIITILCIVSVLLSPVLMYFLDNKLPGAFLFAGAIVFWIITIILYENR